MEEILWLPRFLQTAATPKLTANSRQSAGQLADPAARPRCVPPSLQQSQPLRLGGCAFPAGRLQPASDGLELPPPNRARFPRTTGFAGRHSLQRRVSASWSLGPHLPGAVRSRSPTPPPGRSARPPGPRHQPRAHRYSGAPTWGRNRARKGQSARKVSASGTSSSPRASESLRNFVSRASESALLGACARAYTLTHLHSHTCTHPLARIVPDRKLLHAFRYLLGFHCQVDLSELFATLSEVSPLPLFPSQCLPPTPTSRTNLWNPCRVPPVTHNACSSHGQHRRPPKVLMFGDPLC